MSLTTNFLNYDSSYGKDLRTKLKIEFPKPNFNKDVKIKVSPRTTNFALVGTAFDYLFRFYIEYKYSLNPSYKHWVTYGIIDNLDVSNGGFFANQILAPDKYKKSLMLEFSKSVASYSKFLESGEISKEICIGVLFLGQLEVAARNPSYFQRQNTGLYDENDIDDLTNLFNNINSDFLDSKIKQIYLNPSFGSLSGGADGDLIIGDTLIDIKTTKFFKLKREWFNQIICYYFLSLIDGVNGKMPQVPVKNIGIYFARHGFLWTISCDELGDSKKMFSFMEWLFDYFNKKVWKGTYLHKEIKFDDGSTYVGEIKNGHPHGKGFLNHINGYSYDCNWKNGRQHGKGEIIAEDGAVSKVEWKDGVLVSK